MKRLIFSLIILSLIFVVACEVSNPEQPQLNVLPNQLVLRKMVAIGNSLTMGVQSAGIVKEFQLHSYPYLIAKQMGKQHEFEQPIVEEPGLGEGGRGPLKLVNGTIVPGDPSPADPRTIASNLFLPRPYDNLGISGADLNDVLNTTSGGLFDLVLRNPNFGNMTAIEQALILNPSLLIIWIGNNDVLGAATSGTAVVGQTITSQSEFESSYNELIQMVRNNSPNTQIIIANIPNISDIPYVNTLDIIFRPVEQFGITTPVPVMFDETFQPIDFDPTAGTLYLPLLTEEPLGSVEHVLLPAITAYQQGIGVPDSAALVNLGIDPLVASFIVAQLEANDINPTGQPLPGTLTLTSEETQTIETAVAGFNNFLSGLGLPLVNMNKKLEELNNGQIPGFSGKYVFLAPANTVFSLDGIHLNNAGYALVANEFIEVINQTFGLSIPEIDASKFLGQYAGARVDRIASSALEQVKEIFVR